jgi:hypothetical protein
MPAAIPLIVAAASTAATVYSAKKQAGAVEDAAQQQTDAGRESLALQKEMWQQSQQNLQPWLKTGEWAATTLGGLMGMPDAPAASTGAAQTAPNLGSTEAVARYTNANPRPAINQDTGPEDLMAWRQGRREAMREARLGAFMGTENPASATAQRQSSYTTMRAPDGTVQDVPSQHVPHYTNLGATVVS